MANPSNDRPLASRFLPDKDPAETIIPPHAYCYCRPAHGGLPSALFGPGRHGLVS